MNFNDLSLKQQIEILTENSEKVTIAVLLCFASKLGEMSEAREKLYIATIKAEEPRKENVATINIGRPVWFAFTDENKFDCMPDEIKGQLTLVQIGVQEMIDLFMENYSADGIAFNPFSNKKGIFFADRHIITLAW